MVVIVVSGCNNYIKKSSSPPRWTTEVQRNCYSVCPKLEEKCIYYFIGYESALTDLSNTKKTLGKTWGEGAYYTRFSLSPNIRLASLICFCWQHRKFIQFFTSINASHSGSGVIIILAKIDYGDLLTFTKEIHLFRLCRLAENVGVVKF
jgi:hypothetical protein